MAVSIEKYREILGDSSSTDAEISQRIEFLQALFKTIIMQELNMNNYYTQKESKRKPLKIKGSDYEQGEKVPS